jgi:hypothetical protein
MEYRYYRYSVEGTLSPKDVPRVLGETGGMVVRIDNREGRTEITVAIAGERRAVAESRLGAGVEVSEEEVLSMGAS